MDKYEIGLTHHKPVGYFEEEQDGLKYCYFNVFIGSDTFKNALINNKYQNAKNLLTLLKKETPNIYYLLNNLFYNEKSSVLLNFLSYLKKISYHDDRQDIMYLFKGTNEVHEGQGAGKGVLQSLLHKMLSGLVTSVSNETYNDKFNNNLQNKKVVIFDEVDLKTLRYNVLKNITGSEFIRIEAKGKDAIQVKNVSSWLLFSNDYKLCKDIKVNDRRTFIIQPNPINGSLKKYIEKHFASFREFEETLYSELNNFIHIIAKANDKVYTPLELETNAKRDYFLQANSVKIEEIKDIYKIFTNKQLQIKVIRILESLENDYDTQNLIKLIKLKAINYKLFQKLFKALQHNGFLAQNLKALKAWEILKEELIQRDFSVKRYYLKQTKEYKAYNDKNFLKYNKTTKLQQKKINEIMREMYC